MKRFALTFFAVGIVALASWPLVSRFLRPRGRRTDPAFRKELQDAIPGSRILEEPAPSVTFYLTIRESDTVEELVALPRGDLPRWSGRVRFDPPMRAAVKPPDNPRDHLGGWRVFGDQRIIRELREKAR
ncbi:MAG: hypothetical protein KGL39_33400 [Patescibacteria group bacterium]|nr:hypothetical protein [Patescibacteria group bacterium]